MTYLRHGLLGVILIGIPFLAIYHAVVEGSTVKNGKCASNSSFQMNLGAHIFGASFIIALNIGYFVVFCKGLLSIEQRQISSGGEEKFGVMSFLCNWRTVITWYSCARCYASTFHSKHFKYYSPCKLFYICWKYTYSIWSIVSKLAIMVLLLLLCQYKGNCS